MIPMPGKSWIVPLPPLSARERALRLEIERDVRTLAEGIGPRHRWRPVAYARAAEFLESSLAAAGYTAERLPFQGHGHTFLNLEAVVPGAPSNRPALVVGAHYDSIHLGGEPDCPGANDNASGVAAVLALARSLVHSGRPIRFVFFANEEPPYFKTDLMGSLVYARACRARGDRLRGAVCFDTIGCYRDQPGTQTYPGPLGRLYPDTGNFIAFVSNLRSARLTRRLVGAFRKHATIASQGAAVPGSVPGVGFSDQWSFWTQRYPGVLVTDTGPFRFPEYHTARDTPDTVDFDRVARVVAGLDSVFGSDASC